MRKDDLCFQSYFQSFSYFGAILSACCVIAVISFALLIRYWFIRKFWFPMQERSTYCTLAFIIASAVNFLIQPIVFLAYSYSQATYSVTGDLEQFFRLIYLWTRLSLTSLYIIKVLRLTYAFSTKNMNFLYRFLRNERIVLAISLIFALGLSILLMSLESTNIVLFIESGYSSCVQNFWVPLQCVEAMVFVTLFLAMKDIVPHYKMTKEIFAIFLSNFTLSLIQYALFMDMGDQMSYCAEGTTYRTFVVFAATELRSIVNVIFCVYVPLSQATKIHIPLPNEQLILASVQDPDSLQLLINLYGAQVSEPFVWYLKYLDEVLSFDTAYADQLRQRLQNLNIKYPLISSQKSFEQLFQFYVCASLAIGSEDLAQMRNFVYEYILVDSDDSFIGLERPFQSQNGEASEAQYSSTHQNPITTSTASNSSNLLSHYGARTQPRPLIPSTQVRCYQTNCLYKCIKKQPPQSNSLQHLFKLSKNALEKVEIAFKPNALHSTDISLPTIALAFVQDEIFMLLHVLWKHFFSKTKSFDFIKETFHGYGVARNHLLKFKLSNQRDSALSSSAKESLSQSQ